MPSEFVLRELALAAFANAEEMCEDADCLVKAKRGARGAALAYLGFEELGKFRSMGGLVEDIERGRDLPSAKEIYDEFYSHPAKLALGVTDGHKRKRFREIARDLGVKSPGEVKVHLEKLRDIGGRTDYAKLLMLYVDLKRSGEGHRVHLPRDRAQVGMAHALAFLLRREIRRDSEWRDAIRDGLAPGS